MRKNSEFRVMESIFKEVSNNLNYSNKNKAKNQEQQQYDRGAIQKNPETGSHLLS